jgi:hypothetical protein
MWDSLITPDVMFFFDGHAGALPLYGALAERLLSEYPATKIQVRKTQIGFHDGRLYCCASLTPVRRRAERPEPFLTVTFSLDAPEPSPRLICVPVRPNRFTHHAIIGSASDIDDELLAWLRASHDLGRQ